MSLSRRELLGGMLATGVVAEGSAGAVGQPPSPKSIPISAFPPEFDPKRAEKRIEARVSLNQVGFLPDEAKRAVIAATGAVKRPLFLVTSEEAVPQTVFRGDLSVLTPQDDPRQNDFYRYYQADFSAFRTPGRYRVRLAEGMLSQPFTIGREVNAALIPLLLEYFAVQRCGNTAPELHAPCHLDDGMVLDGPRKGQILDVSGGWHDAGDYLKFVETSSYVVAAMLSAYEFAPHLFASQEGEGQIPALLVHARIGLEWLLKMHPTPEEFYYQVGDTSDHSRWRLPEHDTAAYVRSWKPRTVSFGIGANLAGRCAAAFALGFRLYRNRDGAFADHCRRAAISVYALGLANPKIITTDPYDYYPEKTWADDMAWGGVLLYEITRKREYLQQAKEFALSAGTAKSGVGVYNTHALGCYHLGRHVTGSERERLHSLTIADAEQFRIQADNPYTLATSYTWGTADTAAGAGVTCLLAARMRREGAEALRDVARKQRDFLLGCNPFDICCLIGGGTRYPLAPHHQIANLRGAELRGALIGGPCSVGSYRSQKFPLEEAELSVRTSLPRNELPGNVGVYRDSVTDYITNEPANDYAATLLLLLALSSGK